MVITYKVNSPIEPHQLAELFRSSGIKRPVDDLNRLKKMLNNANLIVTAWDGDKLVGIARALTDFSYCCYLSDLAVDREYQKQGIGQELVTEVQRPDWRGINDTFDGCSRNYGILSKDRIY